MRVASWKEREVVGGELNARLSGARAPANCVGGEVVRLENEGVEKELNSGKTQPGGSEPPAVMRGSSLTADNLQRHVVDSTPEGEECAARLGQARGMPLGQSSEKVLRAAGECSHEPEEGEGKCVIGESPER